MTACQQRRERLKDWLPSEKLAPSRLDVTILPQRHGAQGHRTLAGTRGLSLPEGDIRPKSGPSRPERHAKRMEMVGQIRANTGR